MAKKKTASSPELLPDFSMKYEPATLDHLGLKLYSTLPPVISELVSNAYDAESKRVEITLPQGGITTESEVVVRDYGHGLNPLELQEHFLPVGRNRRGEDGANVWSRNRKRKVTGRKGLGKLAAFGIAEEVDVQAIQSKRQVTIRLNYGKIKAWGRENAGEDFKPEVVSHSATLEEDGLKIVLRKLVRRSNPDADSLRKGLAQRLWFIRKGFEVLVDGTAIQPGDRFSKSMCDEGFSWNLSDLEYPAKVGQFALQGWIGFLPTSSQTNRGIDIFANGKAVELSSFFEYSGTTSQFARAYLVGEIMADFLDGTEDHVSTSRTSVLWETELGSQFREWGQGLLRWAFNEWVRLKRTKKSEQIIKIGEFDEWLKLRGDREQKVAKRLIKIFVNDPNIEPESVKPLLDIVKSSVESIAFQDLVATMETETLDPSRLVQLFDDWRVIEAREHLKLADGRLGAIMQLESYMEANALEVEQVQRLFEQHLWLIDSSWTEANGQATYSKILREQFPESRKIPEQDRRLDILGVRSDRSLTVVELKRPKKRLSDHDLGQIETYVDWMRDHVGTGPDSPKYVNGILLVGKLNPAWNRKIERLQGADIRVETYSELRDRAKTLYVQIEEALESHAPEFARKRRKELSARRDAAISAGRKETKAIQERRRGSAASKTAKRKNPKEKP